MSAHGLAVQSECHERLVQEWLDSQAAGGILVYDDSAETYMLPAEHAMALADDESPVFVARAMNAFGSMFIDFEKMKAAFRGTGAMSWGDHHPCLFSGTEWFFRTGYRAHLASEWIPALDGMAERLTAGARVADVGCGHGASIVAMAEAFPEATFTGIDFHGPSIDDRPGNRSTTPGSPIARRSRSRRQRSTTATYDLICFFDCLHDMGDPVSAARHAREHLADDGMVLLVEPFALDDHSHNMTDNPMAPLLYMASAGICVPNSLSQDVGLGLGAQAGEARLRDVFEQAGFTQFRRATETPMNLIIEARP